MLGRFLKDNLLTRGQTVRFADSKLVGPPLEGIIEHVRNNYMVLSFERQKEGKNLVGSTVRMDLNTSDNTIQLQFETINETSMWPVNLLGLIPIHVNVVEMDTKTMVKPDYIINVPYKVMGAKPIEEKGEGVILSFSPTTILLGTDGYVAKGEFMKLSFLIPRSKEQIIFMGQVTEKEFIEGSAELTITITDMDDKYRKLITDYYKKLRK